MKTIDNLTIKQLREKLLKVMADQENDCQSLGHTVNYTDGYLSGLRFGISVIERYVEEAE